MSRWNWMVLALVVVGVAVGCSKQEEPVAPAPVAAPASGEPQMPASHPPLDGQAGQMAAPPAGPRQVEVPAEVLSGWKGVVLGVTNRTTGTSQDVSLDIGKSAVVEGLEITVANFVPHFSMGGGSITSASNDTVNPAVKLTVKEGGAEVFSGWLFSLYPEAHPFQHETVGIVLKDFVKSE
ncbi:MAG: DUF2155 domain-containing protein [Deferrisomatales bacterium]|nr:DUF2155 domain-containing protein [Deferrisomatales bacterium]